MSKNEGRGVEAFSQSDNSWILNQYDTTWYAKDTHPRSLAFSLFNRFSDYQGNHYVYPNLTADQHTSLIPAIEATIRAFDELDWMPPLDVWCSEHQQEGEWCGAIIMCSRCHASLGM